MGLSKHYHICNDPKLGHEICAILRIPCACVACTSMIDQLCMYGTPLEKQARYQPVTYCTYWPVLGSYNNWNIIHLTPKSTHFEAFDEINQVGLDGISDNMESLVQPGKYGAINKADTTKNGFYVIKFISEAYTLQNNTQIDGQIISAGELVVNTQYLCSMQENTNWYWKQKSLQQNIIVPTCTIIHPCLDVVRILYVKGTPKNVCNRIQAKKDIQRHSICLTDSDYYYILDEIER